MSHFARLLSVRRRLASTHRTRSHQTTRQPYSVAKPMLNSVPLDTTLTARTRHTAAHGAVSLTVREHKHVKCNGSECKVAIQEQSGQASAPFRLRKSSRRSLVRPAPHRTGLPVDDEHMAARSPLAQAESPGRRATPRPPMMRPAFARRPHRVDMPVVGAGPPVAQPANYEAREVQQPRM